VVQLLVGQGPALPRFTFPDDGGLVSPMTGEMTIETILGDI
jgi:hypothetical protein